MRVPRIRTKQTTGEVFVVCYKPRYGLESWQATTFFVHFPDVTLALPIYRISDVCWVHTPSSTPYYYQLQGMIHRKQVKSIVLVHRLQESTLGFAELAEVGQVWLTNSWEQILSVRSHCLMLPAWSQDISSPWFGWMQTSFTRSRIR